MSITQTIMIAVIVPGACLAQMKGEADLLSREAAIQMTVAVCLTNNNVDGLFNVQRQISELERCPPPSVKGKKQLRETVSRSYLRLFQATKEIVLPADQYDRYIVRKEGYNIVKPMRHPEVARAIAFPSEETTLITNAVLRQELDQYRAAKTQMENNMEKTGCLRAFDPIFSDITSGSDMNCQKAQIPKQLLRYVLKLKNSSKQKMTAI
jgi:hypothetical protein